MEALSVGKALSLIPTLSCLFSLTGNKQSTPYNGAQVLKIHPVPDSNPAYTVLQKLLENELLLDTFSRTSEGAVNVMVCNGQKDTVKGILKRFDIPYNVKVGNLGKQVRSSNIANGAALARSGSKMNWVAYHSLETIQEWMDDMAKTNPEHASVETYGKSYRGRDMKVLKISPNISDFGTTRPGIWIDAGIHAREWIAPATATYIANEFLQIMKNDSAKNSVISKFDWYFMPVLNPDGYEFSQTGIRLWRKTLTPNFPVPCFGTDPNRNWNFHWGEKGASGNPCADDYRGKKAASEKEIASSQDYILSKKDHIRMYISFHSFSQLLFVPWGFAPNVTLEDEKDILPLAIKAAEDLEKVHGTKYQVGSPPQILYAASGGSYDWAKGVAGIKFSYTFELRPSPDSTYGFLLPPNEIVPTGEETLVGVETLAQGVHDYYANQPQ